MKRLRLPMALTAAAILAQREVERSEAKAGDPGRRGEEGEVLPRLAGAARAVPAGA